jgi:hypothetical protein
MKNKAIILFALIMMAGLMVSFASEPAGNHVQIQNPQGGVLYPRPTMPSYLALEDHTLGMSVQAKRTRFNGQVQTEIRLKNIGALPNTMYLPVAIDHVVVTIRGTTVLLSQSNGFFAVLQADLIGRSTPFSFQAFGPGGQHVSSLGNMISF